MDRTAHTPGPWFWGKGTGEVPVGALYGSPGKVCDFGDATTYYPSEGTPPSEQDKALIAAAPDLLAEVESQVKWLRHLRSEACGKLRGSLITGIDQSIKGLSAAIAKAKGEA